MKKLRTLRLLATLLFTLFAHNTFAGEGELFKDGRTLKFAIVIPGTDFGKFNNSMGQPDTTGIVPYQLLNSKVGFSVQFGKMYFLDPLNRTMMLGIDVTWVGLSFQGVTYKYREVYRSVNMLYITAYLEVGPSLSYVLAESMAIDVSFKLTPTIGFMGSDSQYRQPAPFGGESWIKGTGFGMRYTPAVYFRYNKLLVGAEFSFGNLSFNYNLAANTYGHFPSDYSSGTSPYSTLRIVLGVKF